VSRTTRTKRPKMELGEHLSPKQYKDGKVRDGTPQHVSGGCENHGGCPWCEGNKQYRTNKRMPIEEEE